MYSKNDNIIVGLLKNMIRKNITYQSEGFKVFDDFFFEVELDVSGFEEDLIEKGIEDLCSNSKWHKLNGANVLSADITCPRLDYTAQKLKFHILKQKLIEFRDLVLNEK
ncbi:hypothetical protein H0I29_09905 [Polaribacter sp. R2A056_3_33]|uniref:hypothetical protein n=1 Tax=Polaribacter sp. R2A056_3_33 TaxID=2745563 RepID=UPI001C4EF28C|nr:hypothetical protein [Polaribacter sp. R2A056_3_33]QXP68960.1 hypothetical protein H0I29_09905 [Polaribacter sp. R2A056_3_33]